MDASLIALHEGPNIQVDVRGSTNSGKTTVAVLLRDKLNEIGFKNVNLVNAEGYTDNIEKIVAEGIPKDARILDTKITILDENRCRSPVVRMAQDTLRSHLVESLELYLPKNVDAVMVDRIVSALTFNLLRGHEQLAAKE